MAHDWGELGQWTGETHFEKQPLKSRLLPIRYFHRMTYSPKKSPRLPFELDSVFFRAEEANGNLIYDPTNHRVHQLSEKFKINGELSASLLGTPVKMTMSEEQSFLLKITNQQPF